MLLIGAVWTLVNMGSALTDGPQDVVRRWRVSQYVLQGENPYSIALQVLRNEVGPIEEISLRENRIFHIPEPTNDESARGVLKEIGPPEAVYPPTAQFALSYTIGLLPQHAVIPVWAVVNVISIGLLSLIAVRALNLTGRTGSQLLCGGCLLVFPPVQQAILSNQFSIAIAAAIVVAVLVMDRAPTLSGLLFSLALLKPSMAIPFLILPLVRGRWKVLVVTLSTQAALLCGVSLSIGERPWVLVSQWVGVAQYFTQGPYSIQTFLTRFHLDNSSLGFFLVIAFLGFTLLWGWWHRDGQLSILFDLLCFTSILWAYHGPYDFVILFLPLMRLIGLDRDVNDVTPRWLFLRGVLFLVVIGLGTWSPAYVGSDLPAQTVRWSCRCALIAGYLMIGMQLHQSLQRSFPRPYTTAVATRNA